MRLRFLMRKMKDFMRYMIGMKCTNHELMLNAHMCLVTLKSLGVVLLIDIC